MIALHPARNVQAIFPLVSFTKIYKNHTWDLVVRSSLPKHWCTFNPAPVDMENIPFVKKVS